MFGMFKCRILQNYTTIDIAQCQKPSNRLQTKQATLFHHVSLNPIGRIIVRPIFLRIIGLGLRFGSQGQYLSLERWHVFDVFLLQIQVAWHCATKAR